MDCLTLLATLPILNAVSQRICNSMFDSQYYMMPMKSVLQSPEEMDLGKDSFYSSSTPLATYRKGDKIEP